MGRTDNSAVGMEGQHEAPHSAIISADPRAGSKTQIPAGHWSNNVDGIEQTFEGIWIRALTKSIGNITKKQHVI